MLSRVELHLELKDGSLHFRGCVKGLLVLWFQPPVILVEVYIHIININIIVLNIAISNRDCGYNITVLETSAT